MDWARIKNPTDKDRVRMKKYQASLAFIEGGVP
jgi:hypothetical protein